MEWHVSVNGEKDGPLTLSELVRRLDSGSVTVADLAWKQGMPDWVPIHTLPEIVRCTRTGSGGATADLVQEKGKQAVVAGKAAAASGLAAFLKFFVNPAGGLSGAFGALAPAAVLPVSLVYLAAFGLCVVASLVVAGVAGEIPFDYWLRILFLGIMPGLGIFLSLTGFRGIQKLGQGFPADAFISASALLYLGLFVLLATLVTKVIGPANVIGVVVLAALSALLVSHVVLILFSGLTRIHGVGESVASFLVPVMILAATILTYLVGRNMLSGLFRGMF
jgi:hypothetical protein